MVQSTGINSHHYHNASVQRPAHTCKVGEMLTFCYLLHLNASTHQGSPQSGQREQVAAPHDSHLPHHPAHLPEMEQEAWRVKGLCSAGKGSRSRYRHLNLAALTHESGFQGCWVALRQPGIQTELPDLASGGSSKHPVSRFCVSTEPGI